MHRLCFFSGAFIIVVTLLLCVACSPVSSRTSEVEAQILPSVSGQAPVDEKPNYTPVHSATAVQSPSPSPSVSPSPKAETELPKGQFPDIAVQRMVIVIEENHSYKQIVGSSDAPYMQTLIQQGALLMNAHGLTHPSQPNYLALFSGSTQGVNDDACIKPFTAPNLASELIQEKLTFIGYSEDLPKVGFSGCSSNGYARKHNPWVQFSNVSAELNRPLSDFPQDFSKLPTVSFVIPNHQDDMHDGTVHQADSWLKTHMEAYVSWAERNQSLLLVTWDEDDNAKDNHIPLIIVGPMIKPGKYADNVNHYNVLRTIEDLYHLPKLGESRHVQPITSIWK